MQLKDNVQTVKDLMVSGVSQLRWPKAERDAWIQALKRENPNRTKWTPESSDRICFLHFVDGIPTKENPFSNHAYGLQ